MRQKVVLYNPKAVFYTMPLSLLAIGSVLDPARYEVVIVDGRLEGDAIGKVVTECRDALCLGVTVLTGAPIKDALAVLRAAKAERPELVTICGGWHPSLFPTEMLNEACIDIVVRGQGEATFTELLGRLTDGVSLDDVHGLSYQTPDGIQTNPERALIDMDSLVPCNYDLIPVERYFSLKGERQLDYISSIGCPFRCAFCADPFVYGRGWKGIGPERLGDEAEALWRRYRFTDLNFQDETFFTHRNRVIAIADEFLRRGLKFSWAATMRADQGVRLTPEAFGHCVESGLRRVLIGAESGSPRMLRKIQKDTTVEQILESAEMCRRHGVAVIFSFIVGFPGESEEDLAQTIELINQLRAMSPKFDTPIFYYKPYPGSQLVLDHPIDMPRTLEDWALFDYVQGSAGPWVTPWLYEHMERFKFYNRHFWVGKGLWKKPLQIASRIRCRNRWFGFPIEQAIVRRLRPEVRLS